MGAIPGAALLDRLAFLRRPAGTAHDDTLVLDELPRIGFAVLLPLDASARIAPDVDRVWIAFLLRRAGRLAPLSPPPEHGPVVPTCSLH